MAGQGAFQANAFQNSEFQTSPVVNAQNVVTVSPNSTTGIVSWWLNNAATSVTADSADSNTLTNNNSVGNTTGFGNIPNVATFNGSNQYLSVASTSALQTGNVDFWIAAWFRTTATGQQFIAGKCTWAGDGEYLIYLDGSGSINFQTSTNAGVTNTANSGVTGNDGVMHFVFAYQDIENNVIAISVDGGAFVTVTRTITPQPSTDAFQIGAGVGSTNYFTGNIGPVAFGKPSNWPIARFATPLMQFLWNGSAGQEYTTFNTGYSTSALVAKLS